MLRACLVATIFTAMAFVLSYRTHTRHWNNDNDNDDDNDDNNNKNNNSNNDKKYHTVVPLLGEIVVTSAACTNIVLIVRAHSVESAGRRWSTRQRRNYKKISHERNWRSFLRGRYNIIICYKSYQGRPIWSFVSDMANVT